MYFSIGKFLLLILFAQIFLQSCFILEVNGASILLAAFFSSKSHQIVYSPILKELAKRGHEVTVLSPVPFKYEGIKVITTLNYTEMMKMFPSMMEFKEKERSLLNAMDFGDAISEICVQTLDLPNVKELRRTGKFDLVLAPAFFNECALAWADSFNASTIIISPVSAMPILTSIFGNPSPPSFVPNMLTHYTQRMSFVERVINFVLEGIIRVSSESITNQKFQKAYRSRLGHQTPSTYQLYDKASLILSNSHFSISHIRPFLPDIIEVAGMHCNPPKPLPKDLEDFVNSSGEDGFILFSLGSVVTGSHMSNEKRIKLLNALSKLKQKVLWKWETEKMEGVPANVKLSKWLPQQDLLGHPKIRAFITHGGFGSTTEAVYHGVPLIGFPMFGDQIPNLENAKNAGYAITLDFNNFTEEELFNAIKKVLNDPIYKKNVQHISSLFRDQPNHPLERAIFWIEYVIRHEGAHHLRSAGRDLNFFQYHSIDVIGFIGTILFVALWITFTTLRFIFRKCIRCIRPSSKQKSVSKSRKDR